MQAHQKRVFKAVLAPDVPSFDDDLVEPQCRDPQILVKQLPVAISVRWIITIFVGARRIKSEEICFTVIRISGAGGGFLS